MHILELGMLREGMEDELTSQDVHLWICTAGMLQHFLNSS